MKDGDGRRSTHDRASSWIIRTLLLSAVLLIGVAILSDLGRQPVGHAVAPPSAKPSLPEPSVSGPATPTSPAMIGPYPNFVPIAKAVTPAVVNIATSGRGVRTEDRPHPMPFDDRLFRRFFGDDLPHGFQPPRDRSDRNLGSGVIIGSGGLIITNNHVVGESDEITVLLADRRQFKAKLVGSDAKTDLALIKIDGAALSAIAWGDSDGLQVGEYVLAVGNPFGLSQTVTMGIVSAIGRASMGIAEYEDFIQTDAAINPGNSGGALVNARGELVGINTAIFSQSGGNMGIGFAVPSTLARLIVEQLTTNGRVIRGWLGVSIQELTPELAEQFGVADPHGVLITDVLENSPAQRGGLERGDIIVEFDGKILDSPTQLRNAVAKTAVGRKASLRFLRHAQPHRIDVTIVEQPKSVAWLEPATPMPPIRPSSKREGKGGHSAHGAA